MTTTTTPDTLDRLKAAFSAALELPADADHAALAYRETPTWDSVAHMQLVVAIENAFDVMLETEDVLALSSFTESMVILRKHGVLV
ncbi:MAG: acyl carrier protein [Gemmatimonadetes bacterium]|nr:acyl carrier protein [Gemmatimonadota bacterium]